MTSRTGFERTVDGERLGSTVATVGAPGRDAARRAGRRARPHAPAAGPERAARHEPAPAAAAPVVEHRRLPGRGRAARPESGERVVELRDPPGRRRARPPTARRWASRSTSRGSGRSPPTRPRRPSGQVRPGVPRRDRARRAPRPGSRRAAAARDRRAADPRARARDARVVGRAAKTDPGAAPASPRCAPRPRDQPGARRAYVPIDIPSLERAGLGDDAALELDAGRRRCCGERARHARSTRAPTDVDAARRSERSRASQLSQVDRRRRLAPSQLVAAGRAAAAHAGAPVHRSRATAGSSPRSQTDDGLERACSRATRPPALRAAHFLAGLAIVAIEAPTRRAAWSSRCRRAGTRSRRCSTRVLARPRRQPARQRRSRSTSSSTTSARAETTTAPVVRGSRRSPPAAADREPGRSTEPTRDRPRRVREHRRRRRPGDRRRRPRAADLAHVGLARRARPPQSAAAARRDQRRDRGVREPDRDPADRAAPSRSPSRKARPPAQLQQRDRPDGPGPDQVRERQARVRRRAREQVARRCRPRNTTERFAVETRASGTFPLNDRRSRPRTAACRCGAARYTVRSTVVSGVGRLPDDRRRPVPRDLVGHPLAAEPAPAHPARDARDVTERRRAGGGRAPPRPVQRGRRARHRALARHRVPARLRARRARASRRSPTSTTSRTRRRTSSTSCCSAASSPRRSSRSSSSTTSATTSARPTRSTRSRSSALAAITVLGFVAAPWIVDLYMLAPRRRGQGRAAGARDRPAAVVHAADPLLRLHRARHRDAQRAPPVRGGRVRAGAQQRRRHRGRCSRCRVVASEPPTVTSVLDDPALVLLLGLGTTAGIVAMALVLAARAAPRRGPAALGLGVAPPRRPPPRPALGLDGRLRRRRTRSRSGSRSFLAYGTAATRPSTSPRSRSSSSRTACSRCRS